MKKLLLTSVSLSFLFAGVALAEEKAFPAKLVAHAILPANTVIAAPADAPAHLQHAGKFTTPDRKRAVDVFSWESVAAQTVAVYERAMKRVKTC